MKKFSNTTCSHQTMSHSTGSRFPTLSNCHQTMSEHSESNGFTTIELLVTLFIAAIFMISGFQLYAAIIKDSGEVRAQMRASNIAYDYMQRYKTTTPTSCTAQTPLTNQSITVTGLASATVSVTITCPFSATTSVSKILVTILYNNPQKTVSNATYTYINPPDTVTDGLALSLDAGNTSSIKGRKSIINWDSWTVGTGGTTGYSPNGDGNSRLIDTNPWGASDIVWDVSNQDAASDADGGWGGSSFNIDNTKMYRFTTFVRRKTIGNGSFYFGTSGGGASVLNRSNAAANSNPYFYAGWWGNVNQWYLVVGYVWPAGSGTGATMPETGIYALDGTKVQAGSDFIWQPDTTSSNHRSYLYYSTDITTNQQWYQPRVDVIDGTEPTVTELINNAGNTWYDLSGNGNNGTLVNGTGYTNTNGGALTFDGVNNNMVNILHNFGVLQSYTISFWAKHNIASKMPIANATSTAFYWYGDNSWRYTHGGAGAEYYYPKAVSIPYGTWGNFSVSYNGSNVNIYRDGTFEGSQASTGTADFSNGFILGNWTAGGYQFNGSMSTVQIYNRALSSDEIQQNFNALRSRYGI